tara:strand:- start:1356 stop:1508 length:153 start_codon:yes stop_codon:yes gene_type:complete
VAVFSNFSPTFFHFSINAVKSFHLNHQVDADLRAVFDFCCAFAAKAGVVS